MLALTTRGWSQKRSAGSGQVRARNRASCPSGLPLPQNRENQGVMICVWSGSDKRSYHAGISHVALPASFPIVVSAEKKTTSYQIGDREREGAIDEDPAPSFGWVSLLSVPRSPEPDRQMRPRRVTLTRRGTLFSHAEPLPCGTQPERSIREKGAEPMCSQLLHGSWSKIHALQSHADLRDSLPISVPHVR